eukprot:s4128_g7.t1
MLQLLLSTPAQCPSYVTLSETDKDYPVETHRDLQGSFAALQALQILAVCLKRFDPATAWCVTAVCITQLQMSIATAIAFLVPFWLASALASAGSVQPCCSPAASMPARRPAPLSDDALNGRSIGVGVEATVQGATLLGATNNGIPLPVKNTFIDVPSGLTPSAMKLDTPYNPLLTAPADLNHAPGFLQRTLASVTSSPQGGLLPISPAAVIHRRVVQSPVATPATPSPSGAKWAKSAGHVGGTTAIPACVIAAPSPTRALAISSTTCTTEATQQVEPLDDDEDDDSGSDQVVPVHLRNPEDAPRAPAGAIHPSLGSEGHDEGGCKRCCFFPRGRCTNGYNCEFCHYEHEKRKRKNKKKIKKKEGTPMAGAMFHPLDLRLCPDLTGTAVLAEAAEILNRFVPRLRRVHRPLNLTNTSHWLVHVVETKQWVRMGERHLLRLMTGGGLLQHFDPSHWSSAPFFRAMSFVKALYRASPLLGGELKRQHLSIHYRGWWRALKSQVTSDRPMDLSLPDPVGPCTLPLVLSDLLQIDSLRFQADPTWDDAAGLQIRQLLASAQANLDCMIQQDPFIKGTKRPLRLLDHFMFSDAHLVFALLDRLDCRVWAPVTTPLGRGTFWMRLPPSSFTEANRVRGLRAFHCDRAFRDLLEEILAAGSPSSFRFVEVGASLGSCTFHVLTRVPTASAVAVEAYQLAAKVMRRTSTWNGLGDRVVVRQAFISDKQSACRVPTLSNVFNTKNPDWEIVQDAKDAEAPSCQATSLEDILLASTNGSAFETVDLLRVHVDGREETVLKSLGENLRPTMVKAIGLAVWAPGFRREGYDPASLIRLLRSRGYELALLPPPSRNEPPIRNDEAPDTAPEKRTRWCRKPCVPLAPADGGNSRQVYTLGTWRVSREVYLWQLSSLDVKLLVDVRGNPRAGREEQLFRGKDFTKALLSIGVRYEYWGDRLGEEVVEGAEAEDIQRLLKGLLASAPFGPICIFGHLHEPQKCHRLQLCNLLPSGCQIQHLMWEDHRAIRVVGHEEANSLYKRWVDFFYQRRLLEEGKRQRERSQAEGLASGWRRAKLREREREDAVAARLAELQAASLPTLHWEELSTAEWEDRLRDGKAYRLRLPWNTEILWYPHFLDDGEADQLEGTVQDRITMYHPTYFFQTPSGVVQETVNRKGQARICDDFNFGIQYDSSKDAAATYVSQKMEPWTRSLLRRIEGASEAVFNAIWFNHYRDGTVTIHWHTDGNEGLGPDPIIGSLSLGATRPFCFKSKRAWKGRDQETAGIIHLSLPLFHGSLVVMGKNSQRHWLHAVPAMEGVHRERTNLTFRFWALEGFETIDAAEAQGKETEMHPQDKQKFRLHVVPDASLVEQTCRNGARLCPVIVDSPSDFATTTGEMLRRLCDHVLPSGIEHLHLALQCRADKEEGEEGAGFAAQAESQRELLDDAQPLRRELEPRRNTRLSWRSFTALSQAVLIAPASHAALCFSCFCLPPKGTAWPAAAALPRSAPDPTRTDQEARRGAQRYVVKQVLRFQSVPTFVTGQLRGAGTTLAAVPPRKAVELDPEDAKSIIGAEDLFREVMLSGIGRYSPPRGAQAEVESESGDWIWEGKGRISQMVFHQSSEFVALYVLSTKRRLQFPGLLPADAGALRRLGLYGRLLGQFLKEECPDLEFQLGVRVARCTSSKQMVAHLVSRDFLAPDPIDLTQQHYLEFTGGLQTFLPLDDLAKSVKHGSTLQPQVQLHDLRCHRCHQFFGDSMRQLILHLRRCMAPLEPSKIGGRGGGPGPDSGGEAQDKTLLAVKMLEEMGFAGCGREALCEILLKAEGSLERAVEPPQMPPAQVPPAPLVLSQALPMQACVQSYAGYPPEADRPVKPLLSVQPVQAYAGPPAEQAVPGQHIIYGPTVGATDGPMQAVPTIVMTSQPSQQMPAQPVVAQQHLPPPPAQTMPAQKVPTAPAPLPPHTVPSMQTMPHTAPPIPPMPHAAHTLAQTMPAQQLPPVGTLPPHIPPHMVTHATPPAAFSPYQYPYQAAAHHQAYGGVLDPTPPPPMQSPKLGQAGFQAFMMPPPMGSPRLPMDMRPMLGMQAAA